MRKNLEFGSDDIETTRERKIFKLIDLEDKQKVKEISAALLGYLRGLGYKGQPSFDLEDIISTTLTQAINKRDEIKNPNDIFWWLLVTAKNYYLNKIKSKKNRPHDSLDTLGDAPNKNLNEEEKLIQKLSREKNLDIVLKNILPGLTDEDILVWKKRYLDDLNPQEVGILIGKSPGAVRIRASRVNKAIRAHFKELK